MSDRAGKYVTQPSGYKAFVPNNLPPSPALLWDGPRIHLVTEAERALGRLDGMGTFIPNPDLFLAMFVKQEALVSSQIEGTQCSLTEVLEFAIDPSGVERPKDVEEVVNYVGAMNYGLERLSDIPMSLRLIREVHGKLMQGLRGAASDPGEFRRSQNWIGPRGSNLNNATFVPPPVPEMEEALGKLEIYLHDTTLVPPLVKAAFAHAQFETIHPFLDGNGRVGRLLIAFFLCATKVMRMPLLYLSLFFKQNRNDYYARLMDVRQKGDWEGWIDFFLRGVLIISSQACDQIGEIATLDKKAQLDVRRHFKSEANGIRLIQLLFRQPLITARYVEVELKCAFGTSNQLIEDASRCGLLVETTGGRRNRQFKFAPYLDLFEKHFA